MKIIEKIHLINWHYIKFETIELSGGINFITGENAGGKSTIIDALQILMQGDTSGWYFNKAANENSKRSLIGYLRGMNSIEEEITYLRNHNFTSYIVMQVKNTETNRSFCIGVIFDVDYLTNSYTPQWFTLDREIPEDGFIKNSIVSDISTFKKFYYSAPSDNLFTGKEYREFFRSQKYMGAIRKEFYSLFQRAVAFKTPRNMREFLEDFVCENINIDIEDMIENIESFKKLENKTNDLKNQIKLLEDIHDEFNKYVYIKKQINKNNYIEKRANILIKEKTLKGLCEKINNYENELRSLNDNLKTKKSNIDSLEAKIESERETLFKLENNSGIRLIEEQKKGVEEKINHAEESERYLNSKLRFYLRWQKLFDELKNLSELDILIGKEEIDCIKDTFLNLEESDIDLAKLIEINDILSGVLKRIQNKNLMLNAEVENLKSQGQKCREKIEDAKKGLKPYDKILVEFKSIIEDKLKEKHKKLISVDILADLIEIKSRDWVDAIEGYLKNEKLNLLIHPRYYQDAINIYYSLDKDRFEGFGLVDIEKIEELGRKVKPGSLAEEIETNDKYAKIYTDYLLGNVMKCNDINNIRNHSISITKDCFLYKNYIVRRMYKSEYSKKFIGATSIEHTLKQLSDELQCIEETINQCTLGSQITSKFITMKIFDESDFLDFENKLKVVRELPSLKAKQKELIDRLAAIDLTAIFECKKIIESLKNEKKEIEVSVETVNKKILEIIEFKFKEENLYTNCNGDKLAIERDISSNFSVDFINEIKEEVETLLLVTKHYKKLADDAISESADLSEKMVNQFGAVKKIRKLIFRDYNIDYGIEIEKNNEYDELLYELQLNLLPKYEEHIKRERENAFEEFRSEFLCRLHDAIKGARIQIDSLNKVLLNRDFGNVNYKFVINPAKGYESYHRMLTDNSLENSTPLSMISFYEQYKEEIDQLFNEITEKGNSVEERERVRKNIQIFTNYKKYIELDLKTINEVGKTSSVSKSYEYNSGGEMQNPYYITVLASFFQMYQMDKKSSKDTMRLIVFDEAFSKMDGDRIKSSIELIKNMKFQVIIAAPSEKIGLIGPEVDQIIHVQSIGGEKIEIAEFKKPEEIAEFIESYASHN